MAKKKTNPAARKTRRKATARASAPPPPADRQFPPGQSGNPAGRPAAGATAVEWMNALAAQDLTEAQMRKLVDDPRTSLMKRTAAIRLLRMAEFGDMADMEPLLDGSVTLGAARKKGINTSLIRKIKVKTRTLRDADGQDVGTEVERELELRDTSGDEFDRVVDRTQGKPTQVTKLTSDGSFKPEPVILMHTAPPTTAPAAPEAKGGAGGDHGT